MSECGESDFPESAPQQCEEGAPLWTTTFGDMMSLLLTFFILMFSMSELKMERFLLASQSLREAVGGTAPEVVEDPTGLMPDPVDPDLEMQNPGMEQGAADGEAGEGGSWLDPVVEAYADMLAKRLQGFVDANQLHDVLSVVREGEGVYLRIRSTALFTSGSAALDPEGARIVAELADITKTLEIGVSVSGHADDRPISTPQFPSNWELSAARAAGVARTLLENGQPPRKLRVESWGAFRPVASNDTPEGRAKNRRVELFYAREDIVKAVRAWARATDGREPVGVGEWGLELPAASSEVRDEGAGG